MNESINKILILEKITKNNLYLIQLSLELRNDYEILMQSVKNNGNASLKLQNNYKIVMEAVKKMDIH
jgi:hypothetical protein